MIIHEFESWAFDKLIYGRAKFLDFGSGYQESFGDVKPIIIVLHQSDEAQTIFRRLPQAKLRMQLPNLRDLWAGTEVRAFFESIVTIHHLLRHRIPFPRPLMRFTRPQLPQIFLAVLNSLKHFLLLFFEFFHLFVDFFVLAHVGETGLLEDLLLGWS